MPTTATAVSLVRAMSSSVGATPGRTLWGGPAQGGGLATLAQATPADVPGGRSKKLIVACYAGLTRPGSIRSTPALEAKVPAARGLAALHLNLRLESGSVVPNQANPCSQSQFARDCHLRRRRAVQVAAAVVLSVVVR
jgi:hypothetical protein